MLSKDEMSIVEMSVNEMSDDQCASHQTRSRQSSHCGATPLHPTAAPYEQTVSTMTNLDHSAPRRRCVAPTLMTPPFTLIYNCGGHDTHDYFLWKDDCPTSGKIMQKLHAHNRASYEL